MEGYPFDADYQNAEFFFESLGLKGVISKRVRFQRIVEHGLVFYQADLSDAVLGAQSVVKWDYTRVSGNRDAERVMITVFNIVGAFLLHHQSSQPRVLIEGFDHWGVRNRLYRQFIARYHASIAEHLVVELITIDKRLVPFEPDTECFGFVVTLL